GRPDNTRSQPIIVVAPVQPFTLRISGHAAHRPGRCNNSRALWEAPIPGEPINTVVRSGAKVHVISHKDLPLCTGPGRGTRWGKVGHPGGVVVALDMISRTGRDADVTLQAT